MLWLIYFLFLTGVRLRCHGLSFRHLGGGSLSLLGFRRHKFRGLWSPALTVWKFRRHATRLMRSRCLEFFLLRLWRNTLTLLKLRSLISTLSGLWCCTAWFVWSRGLSVALLKLRCNMLTFLRLRCLVYNCCTLGC